MFENEEFHPTGEFPHYAISQYGRIKNVKKDSLLKPIVNDKGYPVVTLYGADSRTRYLRQINQLVASAFLSPPVFKEEGSVWHFDGDLLNCCVSNLKWDTLGRVREWNEMHRRGRPAIPTPAVKNNRTGIIYDSAYACGIAESELESSIVRKVERQGRNMTDPNARYMYVYAMREE